MDIKGKIEQILPLQSGTGKTAAGWRKQEFIIDIEGGQYPRKLCLELWGEKIDQFPIQIGQTSTFYFDAESREFNGRWYTNMKCWKIDAADAPANNRPQNTGQSSAPSAPPVAPPMPDLSDDGDLPF